MSFFDRFRRKAEAEQRDVFSSGIAVPPPGYGYGSEAGVVVNENTALQSVAVYACGRVLADAIASLPMGSYRKTADGVSQPTPVQASLTRQVGHDMTNFEWKFATVFCAAIRGNSIQLVTARDAMEYATELMPLHPDSVNISRDDNGNPEYRVDGKRVPASDIVHIKRFPQPGRLWSLSPIGQAAQGIGLALAAEAYGAKYFGQSANPSAVLSTDINMTQEQAESVMRSWKASHGGKREPALLSGGLKYQTITITPEESQFIETRKYQRNEIAMLFGVPPHMIGDVEKTTSWGTGIEQQGIGFVTYTLRPWLTCIEDALSNLLPRGQFVRFNTNALLRGDAMSRFTAYSQARTAGWLNVNEIRALEDLPPVANGDDYLQPLNMGPLGSDPLAAKETPPEPPPMEDPNA